MKRFRTSDAGSRYFKQKNELKMKKAISEAKAKYLTKQPKKPARAFDIFASEKRISVQSEKPELKRKCSIQFELEEMWRSLGQHEKKTWLEKEKK